MNEEMKIVGNQFLVDFGMAKAMLHIQSNTTLAFTILERDGQPANVSETVQINMTALRSQLYMVTWVEHDGKTVTQIHDYENGIIHSNWTLPSGEFIHKTGTLKPAYT
ncbi:MAG TPA: hypothetical protein VIU12_15105 [Chryseolinea sp.]